MPYNALNSLRKLVTSATLNEGTPDVRAQYPRYFLGYVRKPGSRSPIQNEVNSRICKRAHYKYSKIFAKSKLSIHGSVDQKNAFARNELKPRTSSDVRKSNLSRRKDYWKHSVINNSSSASESSAAEFDASKETVSSLIGLKQSQVRSSNFWKKQSWDFDFLEIERQANLIKERHQLPGEITKSTSPSKSPRTTLETPEIGKVNQKILPFEKLKKSGVIYKTVPVNEDEIIALVPDLSKTLPVYSAIDEEKPNVIDSYSQYVSQFRYIPLSQSPNSVDISAANSTVDTLTLTSEVSNQTSNSSVITSPVSKKTTETLSDKRTFLMTREAYNQAQILGFAFNENQKQTKSSYAVDFKLCVVEWFLNNGKNTSATAEKFQIDRKQVYSWHKEREKLKLWANRITNNKQIPSRRLVQKGEWSMYKLLDDRLFERCSSLNGIITVSNEALRSAAIEEAEMLGYKNFKASYIWLQMWKDRMEKKHNLEIVLKNRRLIQWKFPEGIENFMSKPP